ncbi:MAG: hypothetical protein SGI77_15200 [Pirellulaceae bacterium]|nr:hypothetical protein [Pirellulaceae bacterium]
MRTPFSLTLLSFLLSGLVPMHAFGQPENIFGEPGAAAQPFGGISNATAVPSSVLTNKIVEESHVVVQSLQQRPPQNAIDISRAILYMVRIERWDEVGRYLNQLATLPLDATTASKMTRSVGLETWFKVGSNVEKVSEEQRALVHKILELSSGAVRSQTSVSNAISQLNSKELLDRKRGVLAIQGAGESGIAALLESVASSSKPAAPIVSELIITMGDEGKAALKASISTSDSIARERLLLIAARTPGNDYLAELMASVSVLPPTSPTYQVVAKVLAPSGQTLPSADAAQRLVLGRMEAQLKLYHSLRREATVKTYGVWRWSSDGKHLLSELDDAASIHLEEAYRLAYLAIQLAPHTSIDSPLATSIILERNYRIAPTIELDLPAFQRNFKPFEKSENLEYLGAVSDTSMKNGLLGSQLRSIQAIGNAIRKAPQNTATSMARLMAAVKNSPPAIRYSAASALTQLLDSDTKFEGRYTFEQTKQEMLELESKPLALVVGGASELRDALATQLSMLGIRTLESKSARETMRLIQKPNPIEYVFIVDKVLEMNLSELVQRLRTSPRTRLLPLAVLTDRISSDQRTHLEIEGFDDVHYFSVTHSRELTSALLDEMHETSPIPQMDSIDRITFRSIFEPLEGK